MITCSGYLTYLSSLQIETLYNNNLLLIHHRKSFKLSNGAINSKFYGVILHESISKTTLTSTSNIKPIGYVFHSNLFVDGVPDNNYYIKCSLCVDSPLLTQFSNEGKKKQHQNLYCKSCFKCFKSKIQKFRNDEDTLIGSKRKVKELELKIDKLELKRKKLRAYYMKQCNAANYYRSLHKKRIMETLEWRESESSKGNVLNLGKKDSVIMFQFLKYSYEKIDIECGDDLYHASVMKELLSADLFSMGEFNKSGNKRGIKNVKVSSAVLAFSLQMSLKLGESSYNEFKMIHPGMPSWSCLNSYRRELPSEDGIQIDQLILANYHADNDVNFPKGARKYMTLVFDGMKTVSGIEVDNNTGN